MDQPSEPLEASARTPVDPVPPVVEVPPLPSSNADFPITDEQRQAAVNYLDGEVARGTMQPVEAERRKQLARAASTVAELLAATVVDESPAPAPIRSSGRTNVLALLLGLVVAVLLLVTVVPKLF